jgi:hypothetical protein
MVGDAISAALTKVEIVHAYVPENPNTLLIQEIPMLFTDITFDPSCHTFALAYKGKDAEWKTCAACHDRIARQDTAS